MSVFLLIVFGLYFALMLLLLWAWQNTTAPARPEERVAMITVIVPFRNEQDVIGQLLEDITKIEYPQDRFEVIFVNDHSADRSGDVVAQGISGKSNLRFISLSEGRIGKKQALTWGVDQANGEIIVTTDADCRLPPGWLAAINRAFLEPSLKLAIGAVRIDQTRLLGSQLQALEFASIVGVTGATASLGVPTMCNGANLAFLKSAFIAVNGYEGNIEIPSGDDEFLMRKILRRFPDSIRFMFDQQSVVTTRAQKTSREFIDQRLRWAGKWKHNSSLGARALAVCILIVQFSWLLLLVGMTVHKIDIQLAGSLLVTKMVLDYVLLERVMRFLGQKFRVTHFLLLQCLYPMYVILVGVGSWFAAPVWKGRR